MSDRLFEPAHKVRMIHLTTHDVTGVNFRSLVKELRAGHICYVYDYDTREAVAVIVGPQHKIDIREDAFEEYLETGRKKSRHRPKGLVER